jgi:hypothetical protein
MHRAGDLDHRTLPVLLDQQLAAGQRAAEIRQIRRWGGSGSV